MAAGIADYGITLAKIKLFFRLSWYYFDEY